jgi:4-amino-4-deoxy-L-arabinose transferase-like glycosyltransferase
MILALKSTYWVVGLLVLFAAAISWLASKVPPSLNRFAGWSLLACGAFNIVLHRRLGRQVFGWAHMSPIGAGFWDAVGENGAQVLYLGIGIILALAGFVLLIESM